MKIFWIFSRYLLLYPLYPTLNMNFSSNKIFLMTFQNSIKYSNRWSGGHSLCTRSHESQTSQILLTQNPTVIFLKTFLWIKFSRKPGISEECIEKLASVLSKLDNLEKFDIYFRRYLGSNDTNLIHYSYY